MNIDQAMRNRRAHQRRMLRTVGIDPTDVIDGTVYRTPGRIVWEQWDREDRAAVPYSMTLSREQRAALDHECPGLGLCDDHPRPHAVVSHSVYIIGPVWNLYTAAGPTGVRYYGTARSVKRAVRALSTAPRPEAV